MMRIATRTQQAMKFIVRGFFQWKAFIGSGCLNVVRFALATVGERVIERKSLLNGVSQAIRIRIPAQSDLKTANVSGRKRTQEALLRSNEIEN